MEIDRLLDHSDWMRKLARHLVNDPDEAEDLVQDAFRAALESPPRDPAKTRSWLGRVLRNLACSSFRRRKRRSSRERVAAAAEATPSVETSFEKLETARLLIDLVFALDEPGRTVVVLRYFEGLTSREIAGRLDSSPGAVRMRLRRSLRSLRKELEERSGEQGSAWKMLLLPLLSYQPPAAAPHVAPWTASGAKQSSAPIHEGATGSSMVLAGAVHGMLMAAIAVVCFAGGWGLRNSSDVDGSLDPGRPLVESSGAPVAVRSLENRVKELEACLETSRRRVAAKNEEIRGLRVKLAAHVRAGPSLFDPA
jgi:RNA polymerase sigma-70 factor (ECF subfamily)